MTACRLSRFLSDELEIKLDQDTFWTDSMIVLGYIRNESRRFKTFVGNRLGVIHDTTSPDHWCYSESKLNPADIASRGTDVSDTESLSIWLNGPDFIWHDSVNLPKHKLLCEIPEKERDSDQHNF